MPTGLIVALDVQTASEAYQIIEELAPMKPVFKVGGILYLRDGNNLIKAIRDKGCKVFLDLKFFDIPNTVRETLFSATELGVDFFTIHTLGGSEMMRAAVNGALMASKNKDESPLILGVTILTSMNNEILKNELQIDKPMDDMVIHLARKGYEAGLRGFVCSPLEVSVLRKEFGNSITLVTPGIRLLGDSAGDQKRVMTPKLAKEAGSDYIVMGRSILDKPNRTEAVKAVLEELV